MKLSIILNTAVEKIVVCRKKCRLAFASCLNLTGKWSLITDKILTATSECSTYILVFVTFIQEVDRVWSSSNVYVATILCGVVEL